MPNPRVRTRDELKESLARFALTNSSLNPQVLLARFRRRELLRIYLHDIRRSHTLVETTEELSNLADAILDYALSLARQDLDNRYGLPRRVDERGRSATAEFCVIALGKLGSFELNYASDIDLVFLYSDDGTTSGAGERGEVSNREYFVKLSETIASSWANLAAKAQLIASICACVRTAATVRSPVRCSEALVITCSLRRTGSGRR